MENSSTKQTPIYQQEDLSGSLQKARSMCHSVGATLIAAPARSVLDHIAPGSVKNLQTMLANEIPATRARYADAYEIQAQQTEQRTQGYEEYVSGCAAQARRAAPETPILAGLTTNSPAKSPEDYPTARDIRGGQGGARGGARFLDERPPAQEYGGQELREGAALLAVVLRLKQHITERSESAPRPKQTGTFARGSRKGGSCSQARPTGRASSTC
jgi:hypothetical protein